MEQELYDFTSLEEISGGDKEFMDKMIELFQTNIPKEIEQIEGALKSGDYNVVKTVAHKMKPSVNYICINQLFEEVRILEAWEEENEIMINKTNVFISKINLVLEQLNSISIQE